MSLALDKNIGGTRLSVGDVDLAQPLDLTHPLLDGVQGFWLPLPNTTGGLRLYDLSPNNLTSATTGSEWGQDAEIPFPYLNFLGVQGAEGLGTFSFDFASPWTMWGWMKPLAGADGFSAAYGFIDETSIDGILLGLDNGFALKAVSDFETPGEGSTLAEDWFLTGIRYDGSDFSVMLEGGVDYTVTPNGSDWQKAKKLRLGAYKNEVFEGGVTGVGLVSRYLSLDQWQQLHTQARRGFPGLLNTRPRIFGLAGTGGGGALAFNQDGPATAQAQGTDGTLSFQQALQVSQDGVASASAQGQDATTTEQSPLQLLQSAPATAQGAAKDATVSLVTLLQFQQDGVATAEASAQDADAALQVPLTLTQGDPAQATGQSVDATLTVTPNLVFGQDGTAVAQTTGRDATLTFQTALGFVQDGAATVEARGVDATLARQAALAFVQDAPASVRARAKDALFELLAAGDVVVTTPGGETLRATSVAGQPVHDTSLDGEVS